MTSPGATGSPPIANTIGIVAVAVFAANAAGVPLIAASTATFRFTRSVDNLRSEAAPLGALYEEHDFDSFKADGHLIFFKTDYFDKTLTHHSPDPADPSVTERVITIMLAEEY